MIKVESGHTRYLHLSILKMSRAGIAVRQNYLFQNRPCSKTFIWNAHGVPQPKPAIYPEHQEKEETSPNEPRHEKTNVLHMRKQRHRSASR